MLLGVTLCQLAVAFQLALIRSAAASATIMTAALVFPLQAGSWIEFVGTKGDYGK